MHDLVSRQGRRLMLILALFHIGVIAASNYLVQLPFSVLGLHTTWGAFSFPFIFLATDLTVRLFGASLARRIVLVAMAPALVVSYLLSVLFVDGRFAGLGALATFDTLVARIALASFCAYLFGQLLDVRVFARLRTLDRWWIAPTVSTVLGNLLDTLLFFSIAFAGSRNAFMAEHWLQIAWVDYAFKMLISLCVFLPLYGVLLGFLARRLQSMTADRTLRTPAWLR
ncbi:7-cyano-7-deazaguanine/7-aminomethyl-7-deazaguanine transporter [Salinisphaera sp. T31B1]|uniref:7-cyano-7-deazaguanine/7-aminomethyl-7- deazaguanine transporter n=1 Tax=Salinisphaera sp. T31B1 TaxID=727963 RepID=UPI00334087F4